MNKIANILKKGSIALFIMGALSAFILSIKTELKVNDSKYSWKESTYEEITTFHFATMLGLTFASAISCTLTYAFGELIDIEDRKRKYLIARFGEVETKIETENILLTYTVNHEIENVSKNMKVLVDDKSFEKLGYQFNGNNDSTKSHYFKIEDLKIDVSLKKKDVDKTTLIVSTSNNITNDDLRSKMEQFITCLSNSLSSNQG